MVLSSSANVNDYRTEIDTLGEGSWRSIGNSPYSIRNHHYYAFLNGALHWIAFGRQCPFICCFDFVNKQYRAVLEPSEFGPLEQQFSDQMRMGVINENLSICDFSYGVGDRVVVWEMKDYGVEESWS